MACGSFMLWSLRIFPVLSLNTGIPHLFPNTPTVHQAGQTMPHLSAFAYALSSAWMFSFSAGLKLMNFPILNSNINSNFEDLAFLISFLSLQRVARSTFASLGALFRRGSHPWGPSLQLHIHMSILPSRLEMLWGHRSCFIPHLCILRANSYDWHLAR